MNWCFSLPSLIVHSSACEIQGIRGRVWIGGGAGRQDGRVDGRNSERESKTLRRCMTCGGRLGETCAARYGRNGCRAGERDGERSSLGNLFWSTQSADTQGAGKPITV